MKYSSNAKNKSSYTSNNSAKESATDVRTTSASDCKSSTGGNGTSYASKVNSAAKDASRNSTSKEQQR